MPDALTLLQLGLSACLAALVIERARYLLLLAPTSAEGQAFVLRAIERTERAPLETWSRLAPNTHVGQLLDAWLHGDEEALSEVMFDLRARAAARLRALRVGATIASTAGLMVGILRIRGGLGQRAGLLALEAGLAEKMALGQALASMAIGVATSAVCFYAVSLLGASARALLAQDARVAAALSAAHRGARAAS